MISLKKYLLALFVFTYKLKINFSSLFFFQTCNDEAWLINGWLSRQENRVALTIAAAAVMIHLTPTYD